VFWWRALHIGILGIVALQAVLGRACFLTIWESDLLRLAGQMASNEPLIQQWVNRAIYWPLPLWVFAVLYVTVCVYALLCGSWFLRDFLGSRRRRADKPTLSASFLKFVCPEPSKYRQPACP
jgi:hypothetical protein